jgi:hypothetical protein
MMTHRPTIGSFLSSGIYLLYRNVRNYTLKSPLLKDRFSSNVVIGPHHLRLGSRDHDHAAFGYEVTIPIFSHVVTDLRARRNGIMFVNDSLSDSATSSYLHPIHNDRVFNYGITMNFDIPADDRSVDMAAADDGAFFDNGVDSHSPPLFVVKDELGRWIAISRCSDWPAPIIKVEGGIYRS